MGLDINSKSDKEYHAGYSGLHQIRYMGYKAQGGKKGYSDWHTVQHQEAGPDWPFTMCMLFYPNLYWHSDCDGTYTLRGKIDMDNGTLQTGNSKQLLWELNDIRDMLIAGDSADTNELDWDRFNMLRDLVEDVVKNYDGRLELV